VQKKAKLEGNYWQEIILSSWKGKSPLVIFDWFSITPLTCPKWGPIGTWQYLHLFLVTFQLN